MKTMTTLAFGILIGAITATTIDAPAALQAQVKSKDKSKAPVAFLSGSERSLKTLEKISAQLETMDGRVKNIEAILTKASGKQ